MGDMLTEPMGLSESESKLHKGLDVCGQYEQKVVMTGRSTGETRDEFGQYLMEAIEDPPVEAKWEAYVKAS